MLKYRDGPSSSLSTPVSSAFPSPNDRTSYTTGCVDPTIDPSILGGAQALYQSQLDHLTNTGQLPSPTTTFERLSFSSDYSDYFNSDAWEEPAEHSRGGQYDASNYPMGSGPLWQLPLYEMEEDMFAPRDSDYPSPALDDGTEEETTKEVKEEPLASAFADVESRDTEMAPHGGTEEDEDTATSLAHSLSSDKPSKQLKKRPSGNLDLSLSRPTKNELVSKMEQRLLTSAFPQEAQNLGKAHPQSSSSSSHTRRGDHIRHDIRHQDRTTIYSDRGFPDHSFPHRGTFTPSRAIVLAPFRWRAL